MEGGETGKKDMKDENTQILVIFLFVLTGQLLYVSPEDVLFARSEVLGAWLSRWRDDKTQKFRVSNFSEKVFAHMYWAVQDSDYDIPKKYYRSVLKCADYFGIYLPGYHTIQWDGSPRELAVGERIEIRGTFQLFSEGEPIKEKISGRFESGKKSDMGYIPSNYESIVEEGNEFLKMHTYPEVYYILKDDASVRISADYPLVVRPYTHKPPTKYIIKSGSESIVVEAGKIFHVDFTSYYDPKLSFNFEGCQSQNFVRYEKNGPLSRLRFGYYVSSEKIFFTSGSATILVVN
jgi:hypothetical protein